MAFINTFADFLVRLKTEGQVNDSVTNQMFMDLTNECLIEIISNTSNLRDFAIDEIIDVTLTQQIVTVTGIFIANIDQVYWHKYTNAPAFVTRYAVAEQSGIICPAPVVGPSSYTVTNTTVNATTPSYRFLFSPRGNVNAGDKLEIIGTGFKSITDSSTLMPYVSAYPMLMRSILQRLQIYRNKSIEAVKIWDGPIQRATSGVSQGTKDLSNSENDK